MTWCLELERLLLDVADAFEAGGDPVRGAKGPAVAHTVYPDPSWRPVRRPRRARADESTGARAVALFGAGSRPRRIPEPRKGFDERFGKAAVFTTPTGQQIDLHRTLAQGPFGQWIDAGPLRTLRAASPSEDEACVAPTRQGGSCTRAFTRCWVTSAPRSDRSETSPRS